MEGRLFPSALTLRQTRLQEGAHAPRHGLLLCAQVAVNVPTSDVGAEVLHDGGRPLSAGLQREGWVPRGLARPRGLRRVPDTRHPQEGFDLE